MLVKQIVKRSALKVLGLLLKEKEIPVLEPGTSVLENCYSCAKAPLVLNCPRELTRWSLWDGICKEGIHPLQWAAGEIYRGSKEEEIVEKLHRHYQGQWKRELPDISGLNSEQAPGLVEKNMLSAVYPWDHLTPAERYNSTVNNHTAKNRPRIEALATSDAEGELSLQAVKLELRYIVKLIVSIKEKGYLRNNSPDGDIRGELLVKQDGCRNRYRILIRSGQHRFAALLARGDENIPVRIFNKPPFVIRMEEISCWPNVAKGVYRVEGAKLIFEHFFNDLGRVE